MRQLYAYVANPLKICERFFSCLCLTWGHLHKELKFRTRLSVYVERKNVCKWSLVYLQVGKFL